MRPPRVSVTPLVDFAPGGGVPRIQTSFAPIPNETVLSEERGVSSWNFRAMEVICTTLYKENTELQAKHMVVEHPSKHHTWSCRNLILEL